MTAWKKCPQQQCTDRIAAALAENVNFVAGNAIGYPVSRLDEKVFHDAPFLKDAPVLMTYVANPNNIGCHTTGLSESVFKGTQELEREVLEMVAVDIFHASTGHYDGYVASGGTEANLQALWMYRNAFLDKHKAKPSEIAIIASADTHYSIAKGSNLLLIDWIKVPVDFETRKIDLGQYASLVMDAVAAGKKYFIVVANMGTTMFGSVDDPATYTDVLKALGLPFFLHIDAAYGGFVYPFLAPASTIDFSNPDISSITIDAHKMLQAPYGTGIFICRKGMIENVLTKEAEYVEGLDLTLSGSRSGANVVAVWMILKTYGKTGWFEKVKVLEMRTDWLCKQLDGLQVKYFREPHMNIITVQSCCITPSVAQRFGLVPQSHGPANQWYKIVVMEHVDRTTLQDFVECIVGSRMASAES